MPTVPGIPAWAAVVVAVGACVLGFLVDAIRGSELSATFAVMYVLGSFIAVVAVRRRGLFTAVVQPPLIMFFGVPIAYQLLATDAGLSLRDIVLTAAVPLVDRFPLMFFTTLLVLVIGGVRLALERRPQPATASAAKDRAARARRAPDSTKRAPTARAGSTSSGRSADTAGRPTDRPDRRDSPDRRNSAGRRDGSGRGDRSARRDGSERSDRVQDPRGRSSDHGRSGRRHAEDATSTGGRSPQPSRRDARIGRPDQPAAPRRRIDESDSGAHSRVARRTDEPRSGNQRVRYGHSDDRGDTTAYEPRRAARAARDTPPRAPYPPPSVRYRDRD